MHQGPRLCIVATFKAQLGLVGKDPGGGQPQAAGGFVGFLRLLRATQRVQQPAAPHVQGRVLGLCLQHGLAMAQGLADGVHAQVALHQFLVHQFPVQIGQAAQGFLSGCVIDRGIGR